VSAPVEALARSLGADAWRLALVAGADPAAATRAAVHALVIGAVQGGEAAERPAVLALARSWAISSPGRGRGSGANEAVADAFWALDEPLRSALWCTDRVGLAPAEQARVTGSAATAAAVARGRVRRAACRQRREAGAGTPCGPVADLVGRVTAGHATDRQASRVDKHASGCADCSHLLGALGDPTAAVEAALPPVPDLVEPARRAWRDHVGAPRRSMAEKSSRLAASVTSRRRPVAAVLAVVTAGSFGAATTQLAASSEAVAPPPAVAAPVLRAPREPPPVALRPQAVIPPLADEVVADPSLAHVVTRDLAEVAAPAPTLPPPAPPPTPAVAAQPAPAFIGEPPPAVAQPALDLDLELPLPVLLPLDVEVGRNCTRISIGPLRLALPCEG
jgi:hypothetical protein